jgi:hypothetical protein
MMKRDAIKLFENKAIRRKWVEDFEEWFFSIVDVIEVLADTDRPRKYWSDLKKKLKDEGSELSEDIGQLKMLSPDGKMRLTDAASTKQLLRLIQSIPSKKAEPFKIWLASVGKEFIDEAQDPELAMNRAVNNYRRLGYSEGWINQRLQTIETRKILTDEWDKSGVKRGKEYAILTDLMYKTWSGMNAREYKKFKDLKKEGLRDNMTSAELALNMLAEAATTDLSQTENPRGLTESAGVARRGAGVAKSARKQYAKEVGKDPVSRLRVRKSLGDSGRKDIK